MSLQTLTIREATDADIPVRARIISEVNPREPLSAQSLAHHLREMREHPLGLHLAEWVAEEDGQMLATAAVMQYAGMFHAERYHAEVQVLPRAERRGLGTRLAGVVEAHLRQRGAREVLAGAYEDQPHALRFLAGRGFSEAMRFFDNVLVLADFDPDAWVAQAAVPPGVRVLSLAQLSAEQGEGAALAAFFGAFREARLDVPRTGEVSPITLEDFLRRAEHPNFYPDGVQLAVTDTGEVVALSELELDDTTPGRMNTGLTGTRRAWRRKGLALALKLAAIRVAQAQGARELWTGNATTNVPMLAINERLGFRPQPAYIEMKWGGV